MGIVIEDMDLPRGCRECMFHAGTGRKKMCCSITAMVCETADWYARPVWCPMKEYRPAETATVVPQRVEFRWK